MLKADKKRCRICKQRFRDGDLVIALHVYATNERRGDWAAQPEEFAHFRCLPRKV